MSYAENLEGIAVNAQAGLENCSSMTELEMIYKNKRSKYESELKMNSARPRRLLLEDKILKLDTLYRATKEKIEANCPTHELANSGPVFPSSTGESEEQQIGQSDMTVPDSPSWGKVYPLWFIEGVTREDSFLKEAEILVGEKQIEIQPDGAIEMPIGECEMKVSHPSFQTWNHQFNITKESNFPVVIKIFQRTTDLNLKVNPCINYRLFVNGNESKRNLDDCYKLPIGNPSTIKIISTGFDDFEFTFLATSEDPVIKDINLIPSLEYTDMVAGEFPLTLQHAEEDKSVILCKGDRFLFGRGDACSVNLCNTSNLKNNPDELFVSREHFSIHLSGGKVCIEDHSANGTFLNGKIIKGIIELTVGKIFEVKVKRPQKKGTLVHLELCLHEINNLIPDMNSSSSAFFISVTALSGAGRNLTHLLLFESCANARNIPSNLLPWTKAISEVLGASPYNWIKESRFWLKN